VLIIELRLSYATAGLSVKIILSCSVLRKRWLDCLIFRSDRTKRRDGNHVERGSRAEGRADGVAANGGCGIGVVDLALIEWKANY